MPLDRDKLAQREEEREKIRGIHEMGPEERIDYFMETEERPTGKQTAVAAIVPILMILTGIFLFFYNENVLEMIPSVLGIMLILASFGLLAKSLMRGEYHFKEKSDIGAAVVAFILGFGIFFRQEDAVFIIGLFWGIYGLLEAADELNEAIERFTNGKPGFKSLIESIVGFTLSTMLVFEPNENIEHHILILGIELVWEGFIISVRTLHFVHYQDTEMA